MWLINTALRRPITILVIVVGIALGSVLALTRMPVDIFPNLNLPVIYVAQPYGGMEPAQMESFLVNYYEYHFLYVAGIEHVESKSIQNVGLVKLFFHPGTDMSQALAQVIAYVERSKAFMPPGTVNPFVVRFDAGSVPVGQLVFSSETRGVAEISDLALFRVRPAFSTLPGVSAPPPFGGNQRTVVVRVEPDRLRAYGMSPEEVVKAVAAGNTITPAGNVRIGDYNRIAPINTVVSNIQELAALPVRVGSGPTVFVRDVGTVENGSDILTGYGLVNGRRTVYIPVTKRSDASTLEVVNRVKSELPRFQSLVPDDIKVSFEFDQSTYVKNAIRGLGVRRGARRDSDRADGAALPARLAQLTDRRDDDPVRAAGLARRTVVDGADGQHHDARRAWRSPSACWWTNRPWRSRTSTRILRGANRSAWLSLKRRARRSRRDCWRCWRSWPSSYRRFSWSAYRSRSSCRSRSRWASPCSRPTSFRTRSCLYFRSGCCAINTSTMTSRFSIAHSGATEVCWNVQCGCAGRCSAFIW